MAADICTSLCGLEKGHGRMVELRDVVAAVGAN